MRIKNSFLIKHIKGFSLTEKIIFYVCGIILLVTGLGLLSQRADFLFKTVPTYGGTLNEGIIGYPRYINPLLNITDAGRDISSLVYSGLLKENSDGTLSPDLAESYTLSEDGLIYDVYLKKDAVFQDGKPVTADDVVFTIDKAKDQTLKSPEFVNWQGITVSKIDETHVQFTLQTPYASFINNLTLGILPKHIWENMGTDQFSFSSYNYEPIGAGPYQFVEVKRDAAGLPLYYKLKAFSRYSGGKPFIQNITLTFYKSDTEALDALKAGKIDSLGGLSASDINGTTLSDTSVVQTLDLLRTFSVFFKQNQSSLLINKEVRQALDAAVDRNKIINQVLQNFGTAQYSPLPTTLFSTSSIASDTNEEDENTRIDSAKKILTDAGWNPNNEGVMEKKSGNGTTTLAFTLSTSDNQELQQTAELLKEMWEKIGARVEVKIYDTTSLNQNVIRPRKYEALLFGEVIGHDMDLYPFWHSSQRNDPGLNVAMYANIKADKALEEARDATSSEARIQAYTDFSTEISKDVPAVFLYSPQYIYIVPKKLQGFSYGDIVTPQDRFDDIEKKYLEVKKVLNIFNK